MDRLAHHPTRRKTELEHCAAGWAVAGAQFVSLETVEQAQDFVWVATDVQIIDRSVLDDIVLNYTPEPGPSRKVSAQIRHTPSRSATNSLSAMTVPSSRSDRW